MKVLFWSPYTAIWQHSYPESLVAGNLADHNDEPVFIQCNGIFKRFCISMSAFGLKYNSSESEKELICRKCRLYRLMLSKKSGFNYYNIEDFISSEEEKAIVETVESINSDEWLEKEVDGVQVFKLSVYESLLNLKKGDLQFSQEEWSEIKIAFMNGLISHIAAGRIVDKFKPDRVLMYNSLYSTNHVAMKNFEKKNIPVYMMHAGDNLSNRLSTLYIVRNYPINFREGHKSHWPKYKDIPICGDEIKKISEHFKVLFEGKNFLVYSSPVGSKSNIRNFFHIPDSSKKIIVASLSSYDERFAGEVVGSVKKHEQLVFEDQKIWIQKLLDFIKTRPDYFLIIRLHPREFPNKRENVHSRHADELKKLFTHIPENSVINWPTDQISIYDLAKEVDLFLNAWSSVGEEMTVLGIPVLIFSPEMISYPSEINSVSENQEDYFRNIDHILKTGWKGNSIIESFRWYNLKFNHSTYHISDAMKNYENRRINEFHILFSILFNPGMFFQVIRKYGLIQGVAVALLNRRQLFILNKNEKPRDLPIHQLLESKKDYLFTEPSVNDSSSVNCKAEEEIREIKQRMQMLCLQLFNSDSEMDIKKSLFKNLKMWIGEDIQSINE